MMDQAVKRLLWRCRRGTRELDIVLSRFVKNEINRLNDGEISSLEQLLETQDDVLAKWLLLGDEPTDQGMKQIVTRILSNDSD